MNNQELMSTSRKQKTEKRSLHSEGVSTPLPAAPKPPAPAPRVATWVRVLIFTVIVAALPVHAEQGSFGGVRCTAEATEDAAVKAYTYKEIVDKVGDQIDSELPLVFCAVVTSDAAGRGLFPFLPWEKRSVAELPWKVETQPPIVTYFSEQRGMLGRWNMTEHPSYVYFDPDRHNAPLRLLQDMEFSIGGDAVFYAITAGP